MNLARLKHAEQDFFHRYPGGFSNPELIQIRKKHKLDQMIAMAQDAFTRQNFKLPDLTAENAIKVVTRSSLVSVFEKPSFRNFVRSLPPQGKRRFASGLEELLHGNTQAGFLVVLETLRDGRLAKWSRMTICQAYYHPQSEVFIKPTTAKRIIEYFELNHLHYRPQPSWDFYEEYRDAINEMKSRVDASLSPSSIAFTGFLMRSIPPGMA